MMAALMGKTKLFTGTVTTGTVAYASGDVVGGTIAFSGMNFVNTSGVIASAQVVTMSGGSLPLTLFLFRGTPVTAADNGAGTFSATNLKSDLVGFIPVAASDYVLAGTAGTPPCVAYTEAVTVPYQTTETGSLYCVPIARAAHTFTGTSDLVITIAVLQD